MGNNSIRNGNTQINNTQHDIPMPADTKKVDEKAGGAFGNSRFVKFLKRVIKTVVFHGVFKSKKNITSRDTNKVLSELDGSKQNGSKESYDDSHIYYEPIDWSTKAGADPKRKPQPPPAFTKPTFREQRVNSNLEREMPMHSQENKQRIEDNICSEPYEHLPSFRGGSHKKKSSSPQKQMVEPNTQKPVPTKRKSREKEQDVTTHSPPIQNEGNPPGEKPIPAVRKSRLAGDITEQNVANSSRSGKQPPATEAKAGYKPEVKPKPKPKPKNN